MGHLLRETAARAKELLVMQGCPATVARHVTEDETHRFLVANAMDAERAARGLAKRARAREDPMDYSSIDFRRMKEMLTMYWCRDTSRAVLFVTVKSDAFDDKIFLETVLGPAPHTKKFFHWLCEAISRRCEMTKSLTATVILDFEFCSLAKIASHNLDPVIRLGCVYLQEMLPERLEKVYCLNCPVSLSVITFRIKRFCNAQTAAKIIAIDSAMQIPPRALEQKFIPKVIGGTQSGSWLEDESLYNADITTESSSTSKSFGATFIQANLHSEESRPSEVHTLFALLEKTITKSDECERINLLENLRLRRKLYSTMRTHNASVNPAEALLASQLEATLENRDSYRRAVLFARNFIQQEMIDRRDFVSEIEAKIDQKHRENLCLVEALRNFIGDDAPDLLR